MQHDMNQNVMVSKCDVGDVEEWRACREETMEMIGNQEVGYSETRCSTGAL